VFSGLTTFDVDFHEVDDEGRILLTRDEAVSGARPFGFRRGMPIQLWDEESGFCLARVLRVRRSGQIEAVVAWSTWSPAPVAELERDTVETSFAPAPAFSGERVTVAIVPPLSLTPSRLIGAGH
jgi:hypothetical protein